MSRKQEVWTRQCSDGRACDGLHNTPSFVPDDVDVCDHCLAAQFELDAVYDSCSCGHYSEQSGYSTESVLRALRAGMKPKRFYFGVRVEWLDKAGNVTKQPKYGSRSYAGVYDGSQPSPRSPIEEKLWTDPDSAAWAHARVAELNKQEAS